MVGENLSIEVDLSTVPETEADCNGVIDSYVDTDLIESIWIELEGRANREQIRLAILDAEAKYQDATIKIYVPVFIRQDVLKRLK